MQNHCYITITQNRRPSKSRASLVYERQTACPSRASRDFFGPIPLSQVITYQGLYHGRCPPETHIPAQKWYLKRKKKKHTHKHNFVCCPSIFPKGENGPVFCKLNPFLWTCWSWCRVMPSEHRVPEISIWDKMRQY